MELEGLRAIAAIVVVIYHASLIFYPSYFYGLGTPFAPVQNAKIEASLYQSPFSGLMSGTFAVGIFFVLSGFVLTIAFFQKKDQSIIKKMAAKRYIRLMVPALCSIVIAWAFMKFGWTASMAKTVSVTHSGWMSGLWTFVPHLRTALYQGFLGIFTSIANVTYNPVLWTINYEFLGSFIVFSAALLIGDMKNRWLVYFALMLLFANSWLLGFIFGMILADLYAHRYALMQKIDTRLKVGLIVIGVVFGGYPSGPVTSPLYKILAIPGFEQGQQISFYITLGAVCVVFSALTLRPFAAFLAQKRISGLGKYTYSLYLIHMPILFTVCTGSFLLFRSYFGFHTSSVLAILTFLAVLPPVVYLFERFIDAPAIRLASFGARLFIEGDILRTARHAIRKTVHYVAPRRSPQSVLTDAEIE